MTVIIEKLSVKMYTRSGNLLGGPKGPLLIDKTKPMETTY